MFAQHLGKGHLGLVRIITTCHIYLFTVPVAVGTALRNNPFAPIVPCHRVVASSCYIGEYLGEWGIRCQMKFDMLGKEGVEFTPDGYLVNRSVIWRG